MVLKPVVEPILVGCEADQDSGWAPMPGNQNFSFHGEAKVLRQVILHSGQGHRQPYVCPRRRAGLAPPLCG